jgi:FkbH-like protein
MSEISLKLISDFNAEPLARYLRNAQNSQNLSIDVAPYGQVYQSLNDGNVSLWGGIIWTLPERVIPSFAQVLNFEEVELAQCLAEVDLFADAILHFSTAHKHNFVASWVLPPDHRGYGMLDWRPGVGASNLLARMNLRLAERLADASNIYLLDAERWLLAVPRAQSPKMWYAAKVPYVNQVFERAAAELSAAIQAVSGRSKKLVILDLDNTLWGGVIGETGWEGIRLGGHDHIGEAFCDFQRALKALSNRGIQLAIVSKNDEPVALEAIDRHGEMILRRNQFAGWRINWNDKAENIAALVEELNLGFESAIFIDDNPAERERVRGALPEVMVPEWPADPSAYASSLRALDCFDVAALSKEDRNRTAMYVAERERRDTRRTVASPDEWLHQLSTCMRVSRIDKSNIARVAQLFNKTNQLNLSTRRLSEIEILDWAGKPQHSLLALSASDRFGDMGLVGVIGVAVVGTKGHLVDFILSCRVMGRKIENAMIHLAVGESLRLGANEIEAKYLQTARNRPTLDVLRGAGLMETADNIFRSECKTCSVKPDAVKIEFDQLNGTPW